MRYQHIEVKDLKSKETLPMGAWRDKNKIEEGPYPAPVKKIVKNLLQD